MKKKVIFLCYIILISLFCSGCITQYLHIPDLGNTSIIKIQRDYYSNHDMDTHLQNYVITDSAIIKQITGSFDDVRFRQLNSNHCDPYKLSYELSFWDENNQLIASVGVIGGDTIEYSAGNGRRLHQVSKGQIDYDTIENLFDTIDSPNTLIYDENTYIPEEVGNCGLIVYENEAKGIAPGMYLLSSDKTYTINHGIIGKNRWNNEVLEHEPTCTCKLAIHNSDHIEIYSYCAECGILYDWHDCCYLELTEESQHTINDVLSSYLYGDVN